MAEQSKSDEQERKRRRWKLRLDGLQVNWPLAGGLTIAGTGVFAVVVLVVNMMLHHGTPDRVEVPDVVGMHRTTAEGELLSRGLRLRSVSEQASDEPAGTVLRTDPDAGSEIAPGRGVALVLARIGQAPTPTTTTLIPRGDDSLPGTDPGPGSGEWTTPHTTEPPVERGTVQIPDLIGLNLAAARTGLAEANLTVGSVTQEEANEPADTVLRTNPPAGAMANANATVNLVVAKVPLVSLGVGRADPDPTHPDCATGYQTIFSQQISVTAPTMVVYQWERSDHPGTVVRHTEFTEPGTHTVTDEWRRWAQPGETIDGWEQLTILKPRPLAGQRLLFSRTCPHGPG